MSEVWLYLCCFVKQKTADEMRSSDWSSDVCSSDLLIGAQIGGAVKNVLAIACGIVIGRRLGDNARAALITRGLAEMARLAEALGARRETVTGLSGLGDLVLTCSGPQSRNLSLGIRSEEHTSELPSLMRRSYAVFCL